MDQYFHRTLSFLNTDGQLVQVNDVDLIDANNSVVILGEPGMGKTQLLRHIATKAEWTFRSAPSFVSHPDPASLIPPNGKVVIDGLDELSATNDGDAIHRVLGQLIKAGRPQFILSCRVADWRGALARQDIGEEYGDSPIEMTLAPFSSEMAEAFLSKRIDAAKAKDVVKALDKKGLPDFYGNPLTLTLIGEVVGKDGTLPETRAGLLERSIDLMWTEHNPRHDNSALASLDKSTALKAAGAACAAFILTGSEALSLKPLSNSADAVVRVADLQSLPGGSDVPRIAGSRLFPPVPGRPDTFKPIHRTIAEYLGAAWIGATVKTDEARDRVLAIMTVNGGVPASIRGLYAWLASYPSFRLEVIQTDPYGVLRYGDADNLSIEEGRTLLRALKNLHELNPYFRAEDWGHHSAKGLAHIQLLDEVRDILLDAETGFHLRTLILSAIRGSDLANALVKDLTNIMLNAGSKPLAFGERQEAALALLALKRGDLPWPDTIHQLNLLGDEDSTRLSLDILEEVNFEGVPVDLIVESVFAHLGLLDSSQGQEENLTVGVLYPVSKRMPLSMVRGVLDEIAEALPDGEVDGDYRIRSELADFLLRLIGRVVAENGKLDPVRFLGWMRTASSRYGYSSDEKEKIRDFLRADNQFRHQIQEHVVFVETGHDNVWGRIWRLADLNEGLSLTVDDSLHILAVLAASSDRSHERDEIWRDMLAIGRRYRERLDEIVDVAARYAEQSPALKQELEALKAPLPEPEWQIKERSRQAKAEAEKQERWAKHREDFAQNEEALMRGELRWAYSIAQTYLGLFADLDKDLPPADRVTDWLGQGLTASALVGLETLLFSSDLPSAEQLATSYAESRRWHYIYPMIAGVAERLRTGRSIDDLNDELLIGVRIALHFEHFGDRLPDETLHTKLDQELRLRPGAYERYIRLLIEPALRSRNEHVQGLYPFARNSEDAELSVRLAAEWLREYSDLPVGVESELLDILVEAGAFDILLELAKTRESAGYSDHARRRNWQAIWLLVDFPGRAVTFAPVQEDERDFLWHIRNRIAEGRRTERFANGFPEIYGWVVENFRYLWPNVESPGSSSGDTNKWDASAFLRTLINRLGSDTSETAVLILERLISGNRDGYTDTMLYAADLQRQEIREKSFPGVSLDLLSTVLSDRPPTTSGDLVIVLQGAFARLQMQLHGNDTDTVKKYWRDSHLPQTEDRCTDLLIEDLERILVKYDVGHVSQADMPNDKIADIVFTVGNVALPVECKGQWNLKLWSAAIDQLEALYMRDWRSQDKGIYLVYWFGPNVQPGYRLKSPADGSQAPSDANELRRQLEDRIPKSRRENIHVEVLDFTR